jgi:hypothetical protein
VTLNSPTFKPALFIYFDGSFKKLDDKSVGSIGFIITNQGGDTLHKNKKVIENVDSSTESEYKSLEASLDTVLQKYGSNNRLFIFGDEKTIINKLNNNRLGGEYKNIMESIVSMAKKFNSVIFSHISQSENKKAHMLSNTAIKNSNIN